MKNQKIRFHTLIGHIYITKMTKTCGTKCQEKLITMDCILKKGVETKRILYCLLMMLKDMAQPIDGLLIQTMNNSPFLSPALLGGLLGPPLPRGTSLRTPPGTPHPTRRSEEQRNKQRRAALALPKGSLRSDDDEEEKENRPPPQKEDDVYPLQDLVSQLLAKWGEAIDQLQEQISQDLKDFRQRLGIRQS
uniref:E4 protein n=1 Tax=Human papillomavirus TaxID=10566 RepID=A0A385PKP2_9PAPI|nr:MAG: E4 protein [Human papillomavirus]